MTLGAGLLLRRPEDGRVFLVRRSRAVTHPGHWGPPGGSVEPEEEPIDAAFREAAEELGALPAVEVAPGEPHWWSEGPHFAFATFLADLAPGEGRRWRPRLNWENDSWDWFDPKRPPLPLLSGAREAVKSFAVKKKRKKGLALGIVAPAQAFSAFKIQNVDPASPGHLSAQALVRNVFAGYDLILVLDVLSVRPGEDEKGVFIRPAACGPSRGPFGDLVNSYFASAEEMDGHAVFCVEEADFDGVMGFLLDGMPGDSPFIVHQGSCRVDGGGLHERAPRGSGNDVSSPSLAPVPVVSSFRPHASPGGRRVVAMVPLSETARFKGGAR